MLITICIILLINLIFIASLGSEKKENNAFQKNPNSWSDKDKEQVNDFFDWHHDYYD